MLRLALPVAALGGVERLLERADLAAERGDLLVQKLDLRERPLADLLLALEVALERRRCGPPPRRPPRCLAVEQALQAVALALGGGEVRLQGGERLAAGRAMPAFSSDRSSVSSAICALRRFSTVSLLVTSWPRKNCARMNTESRKTKTSSSVASASTKPGQ